MRVNILEKAVMKQALLDLRMNGRLLSRDRNGAVAILFALLIIPIIIAVGLSVDFVITSDTKAKLDSAADTAALAGAIAAKGYLAANQNSGYSEVTMNTNAAALGKVEAEKVFKANAQSITRVKNASNIPLVSINGQNIVSSLNYAADVPLSFGPIIGTNQFHLDNTAVAQTSLPTYLDIYVVLDTSASMGVGATQADIDKMIAANQCAFGCHVNGDTHYDTAHAAGAVMRIDVLRDSIGAMLAKANQIKSTPDLFQFSLHTFSNDLATLQTPTVDYSILNDAMGLVAPTTVGGGTNFHVSLGQKLPPLLPQSGDGRTASNRKTHVILVTDAVEDCANFPQPSGNAFCDPTYVNWFGNGPQGPEWNMQAFDPTICDAAKNTGATLSVLNVTYVAPANVDVRFDYVRNNVLGRESSTIGGCASSMNNFYTANSPEEIKAAINAIFGQITQSARLTN